MKVQRNRIKINAFIEVYILSIYRLKLLIRVCNRSHAHFSLRLLSGEGWSLCSNSPEKDKDIKYNIFFLFISRKLFSRPMLQETC